MCCFTDLMHSKVSWANNTEEDRVLLITVCLKVYDHNGGRELVLPRAFVLTPIRSNTIIKGHYLPVAAEWCSGVLLKSVPVVRFGINMQKSLLTFRFCKSVSSVYWWNPVLENKNFKVTDIQIFDTELEYWMGAKYAMCEEKLSAFNEHCFPSRVHNSSINYFLTL